MNSGGEKDDGTVVVSYCDLLEYSTKKSSSMIYACHGLASSVCHSRNPVKQSLDHTYLVDIDRLSRTMNVQGHLNKSRCGASDTSDMCWLARMGPRDGRISPSLPAVYQMNQHPINDAGASQSASSSCPLRKTILSKI